MKKIFTLSAFLITLGLNAQTTLTLRPGSTAGQDAYLASGAPNSNYGNHNEFAGSSGTCGGTPCHSRGLIKFDFSSIPSNATITSAKLFLYASKNPNNNAGVAMSGSDNSCYLQRVTSAWTESAVNWTNQPTTTIVNQLTLATSTSATEDYLNLDVTSLVTDIMNSGSNNGFMLRLQTEQAYNYMQFASSDHPDTTIHPKIVITYTSSSATCLTLRPKAADGKDAYLASGAPTSNYGNHNEFAGSAGTCGGSPCNSRGLMQFNLSSLPGGATITDAHLSLYASVNPNNNAGVAMSGSDNSCYLLRVTAPWDESTVNWDNQPATTTQNQVALATSTSATQNYLNIDLTDMVKDMVTLGNYGFMIKLQNETYYNYMQFASSDHPDTTIHPKLTICYSLPTGIQSLSQKTSSPEIFPNPFANSFKVKCSLQENSTVKVEVFNVLGTRVYSETEQHAAGDFSTEVNTESLQKGNYFIKLILNNQVFTQKLIKL